jgi:hypothetical protein
MTASGHLRDASLSTLTRGRLLLVTVILPILPL